MADTPAPTVNVAPFISSAPTQADAIYNVPNSNISGMRSDLDRAAVKIQAAYRGRLARTYKTGLANPRFSRAFRPTYRRATPETVEKLDRILKGYSNKYKDPYNAFATWRHARADEGVLWHDKDAIGHEITHRFPGTNVSYLNNPRNQSRAYWAERKAQANAYRDAYPTRNINKFARLGFPSEKPDNYYTKNYQDQGPYRWFQKDNARRGRVVTPGMWRAFERQQARHERTIAAKRRAEDTPERSNKSANVQGTPMRVAVTPEDDIIYSPGYGYTKGAKVRAFKTTSLTKKGRKGLKKAHGLRPPPPLGRRFTGVPDFPGELQGVINDAVITARVSEIPAVTPSRGRSVERRSRDRALTPERRVRIRADSLSERIPRTPGRVQPLTPARVAAVRRLIANVPKATRARNVRKYRLPEAGVFRYPMSQVYQPSAVRYAPQTAFRSSGKRRMTYDTYLNDEIRRKKKKCRNC